MRIDHGRAYVAMTQQFLHRAYVVTPLQQMRGEAVAQRMGRYRLVDSCKPCGFLNRPLQSIGMRMVPKQDAAARVLGVAA